MGICRLDTLWANCDIDTLWANCDIDDDAVLVPA